MASVKFVQVIFHDTKLNRGGRIHRFLASYALLNGIMCKCEINSD